MTSKNLFFKLMAEDIKRRLWAVCLAFLAFFFWMPVAAAMGLTNLARDIQNWIEYETLGEITLETRRYAELMSLVENVLGINPLVAMSIVGAAVLLGLTGFSFLHNKSKVDFYHSAPVRRELLFLVKFVDGILIVFSMYLLNMLIACGLFAVNGAGPFVTLGPALVMLLVHLAGFLLFYALTVTAVLMTGNFIISVLGTIVFFSYVPALTALLMVLAEMFFMTNSISGDFWTQILVHGSPVSYYVTLLSEISELDLNQFYLALPRLAFPFAVSAGILFFCFFLYQKRPSEAAGKAMAFRISKAPLKVLIVVPNIIFMSLFFWSIYESMGWAVFGFLFGLLVSHCVIEIIYHFDFRKLFANWPHMVLCGALALAVIGIYRFDLVGYDKYLPSQKKFASAAITCTALNDWNNPGIPEKRDGEWDRWNTLEQSDYVDNNMTVTDYEIVRALAEFGIEEAAAEKKERFSRSGGGTRFYSRGHRLKYGEAPTAYWTSVYMTYRLKSGRTVSRYYSVDVSKIRDTFDRLYASEEYKRGVYPVLAYEPQNVSGVFTVKNSQIQEVNSSEAFSSELLKVYQEELNGLTLNARQSENPVAGVRFLTDVEREYLKYVSRSRSKNFDGDFRLEDVREVNFYPVYPSFTKTIALLKEAGMDVEAGPDLDDIDYVRITSRYRIDSEEDTFSEDVIYDDYYGYAEAEESWSRSSYAPGNVSVVIKNTPEERREIERLLGTIAPEDCIRMNNLQKYDSNIEVQIYLKSQNKGRQATDYVYNSYLFVNGEVPEFLTGPLQYNMVSQEQLNESIHFGLNVVPDGD